LCTDSHVSYIGFALDHGIKHVTLRSDLKQFVKKEVYHIQHVNSLHSRLKGWIKGRFQGVSTKYLQNYLNWFRLKEKLKKSKNFLAEFFEKSMMDAKAINRYRQIDEKYLAIMKSATQF